MIREAGDMVKEIKERFRGGEGSVEITHMFQKEELTGKARLCAKLTLNPGSTIGLHEHSNEEEIFYIIKGKGLAFDNGVTREVKAGDAILTVGGTSHSVNNTGDEPLELLAVILLY